MPTGEIHALVGLTGAGETTLMRSLLGVLRTGVSVSVDMADSGAYSGTRGTPVGMVMRHRAERLPDGRLRIPVLAEGPDGETTNEMLVIDKDHRLYARWSDYLTSRDDIDDSVDQPRRGAQET